MKILGIDPGTRTAGYAIVSVASAVGSRSSVGVCACDVLKLGNSSDNLVLRVGRFYEFASKLIQDNQITALALETSFLGKNPSNFLKLGYIRGALYVLAHQHAIPLFELSPSEIKRSITGSGSADKEQVARVLQKLFPGLLKPATLDATDALGVALACSWLRK